MEDTEYMDVKTEIIGANTVKLEITESVEVLEEGLNASYKKYAKRFTIPGFRKGRAPRAMVERYYGAEVLYEGAIDAICPKSYEAAIKENNIEPVDSPEIDIVEIERGKPFVFTATVVVKPEVKLGLYKGLEVPYQKALITDDDVEAELRTVADKNARLVPVEDRPVREGDTVLIDYEGFLDGTPFEGGKGENYNLEIGSHKFIAGFEEQLIGKEAGESADVEVRFPDDYGSEEMRGKEARFHVTIHAIKIKELPDFDDDFAQDFSEFDTLDEYKADIRRILTEDREAQLKNEFEGELLKRVAAEADIDIPEAMIKRQIERNIKEFEMTLAYQGIDLERYYALTSTTREDLEKNVGGRAADEVKTMLVLDKIAKEEEIEVTDEEYDDELRKRAANYKKEFEEYKGQVTDDLAEYIKSKLKTDKIIAFLAENAKRI